MLASILQTTERSNAGIPKIYTVIVWMLASIYIGIKYSRCWHHLEGSIHVTDVFVTDPIWFRINFDEML